MNNRIKVRRLLNLAATEIQVEVEDLYGNPHSFIVEEAAYNAYCNGEPVQNCFPNMRAQDRELFITGISEEHWKDMFGEIE